MSDNQAPKMKSRTGPEASIIRSENAVHRPEGGIDFDDYSANYNELLRESTKLYADDFEYFAKYKVDLIERATSFPVKRVLEYGCGTGRNIGYLQRAFPNAEIVGSDISAASLALASSDYPMARFEIERDDLELGQFDLIFVASVFHHIPPNERPGVMKALASRLEANGCLHIFEHNPFNPVTRRIVSNCPFDADAILLRPAEMRNLCSIAELNLQQQSYCLFVPPRFPWFMRFEKYLGWLPLGGQYWLSAGRCQ